MSTYYIVTWAGMWHVYRGEDPVPVASHVRREVAEHWCRSDAGERGVSADVYFGERIPHRVSA